MSQFTFTGLAWNISNLNANFNDLYNLRELISSPGYTAATPGINIRAVGVVDILGAAAAYANFTGSNARWHYEAATGKLTIAADNSAGNTEINFRVSAGAGSVLAWKIDSAGSLLGVGATAQLGYGTGSGGSVTQLTSKSTAVTLNKANGLIVMNNAALAAGARVLFTLNNTLISAAGLDVLVVAPLGGSMASAGSYRVEVAGMYASSAIIAVTNLTAGSLSEALQISFAVIKTVSA